MFDILLTATAGIVIAYTAPLGQNIENYRWISTVTNDPHGISDSKGTTLSAPYLDPPPTGYQYEAADTSPYYWDDKDFDGRTRHRIDHPKNRNATTLTFQDHPRDNRLKGDEYVGYNTCLVDTTKQNMPIGCVNWILDANNQIQVIPSINTISNVK